MNVELLFNELWTNYTKNNPSVLQVYNSFIELNENVINDHIALRTFNDKRVNIDKLSTIFLKLGYEEKGKYHFNAKKLNAKHFEHKDTNYPRVFISELILEEFSAKFQFTVQNLLQQKGFGIWNDINLLLKGRVWDIPSYEIYKELKSESEYGAWLYIHGFCANHFTVSINALKTLKTIEEVNHHLKNKGFTLNMAGGEIKGTKQDLLQQSSIMAEKVKVQFKEGIFQIPGCYYEFAVRYPDKNGLLYNGFIAQNADKIFESTHNK